MKRNHFAFFRQLINKVSQHQEEPPSFPLDVVRQDQIRAWIREEMKQEQHNIDMARWKDFKISTDLSVPELSYFIKLLCDTGMIKHSNITELMEFFSTFFASVNTPNISVGSLRKKFYTDNAAVATSIRDRLILLINESKKKA